ncbi:MAG: hypothetical protein WC516_08975 [Patescibacteria group bacterium]|jgi:hypothetical protein
MGAIFDMFLVLGMVVGWVCLNALVLTVLWGWFMMPLGLHPIGVAMAIGLGTIVALFSNTNESKDNNLLLTYFMKLGLLLLIGWIAHQCI